MGELWENAWDAVAERLGSGRSAWAGARAVALTESSEEEITRGRHAPGLDAAEKQHEQNPEPCARAGSRDRRSQLQTQRFPDGYKTQRLVDIATLDQKRPDPAGVSAESGHKNEKNAVAVLALAHARAVAHVDRFGKCISIRIL